MIDIIEFVEGNLESMLNSGEVECPAGECDNRRFRVTIWRDDERGFVGDASCRDSDLQIELNLANEPIDCAESIFDELQTAFRSPS
ncbi:hypothetical protein [Haladaptatus sp. NG-WS-4]